MREDLVGKEYEPFHVTVEQGKIREFCEALSAWHEIDRDTAPPTFSRNFWWEGYQVHHDLGFDWRHVVHGEQEFEYVRPLEAGARLTGQMRIARMFEKAGRRGGSMTFAVVETTYRDQHGDLVLVGRRTLIETQPPPPGDEPAPPPRRAEPLGRDVRVGQEAVPLLVGPLTRTDFVRYAGAAGDFNPNHHDEIAAIRAGNEAPFGMGMLAAGYLARLLEEWFADGALTRYRTRFSARFWPGDVLTCRAVVTGLEEQDGQERVEVEGWVENREGERVISGDATGVLG